MANNDARKISGYDACTAPEANALLVVTGNTAGQLTSFNITVSSLLGNSQVDINVANNKTLAANNVIIRRTTTPNSSTDIVAKGTIWSDGNYLYIAVADNSIKRVALSSF